MSEIAIRVEGLSKRYLIGQRETYSTLRDTLARSITAPFRLLKRGVGPSIFGLGSSSTPHLTPHTQDPIPNHIWVLKDVSFEVKKGEVVGIIGPNGSGKSTLLKLMSRITEPTEGAIYIDGRVTALIELGAGFHPELTGRENIFLNGAILGLTKKEIEARFGEIVDFAELWDFIDTPVKHYSTGMIVRLGFAVAVSVDPEILLIDEVLSVGDAAFRRRCLEKIDAFINAGKTIVIVTHNLQEIQRIARRALLIYRGLIQADDAPDAVIGRYAKLVGQEPDTPRMAMTPEVNNGQRQTPPIEVVKVQLCGGDGNEKFFFRTHDELQVRINYVAHRPVANPVFRVQIYRSDGLFCHGMNTGRHGIDMGTVYGEGTLTLRYPDLGLLQGDYSFHVAILATPFDDLPLHQLSLPHGVRVESEKVEGGGVLAMRSEWIIREIVSNAPIIHDG